MLRLLPLLWRLLGLLEPRLGAWWWIAVVVATTNFWTLYVSFNCCWQIPQLGIWIWTGLNPKWNWFRQFRLAIADFQGALTWKNRQSDTSNQWPWNEHEILTRSLQNTTWSIGKSWKLIGELNLFPETIVILFSFPEKNTSNCMWSPAVPGKAKGAHQYSHDTRCN